MRRTIFKHSLLHSATLLILVNILTTALTLIGGLYLARSLNTQHYGQYAYMANVFLLAILFLGFGLTSQVSKDVAEYGREQSARFQNMLNGLAALRIATALLAGVGGALLWAVSGESVYLYAGCAGALYLCIDFVVGVLSGLQQIKRIAILLLAQPLSFMLLLLALPVRDELATYNIFLASQVASALAAGVLIVRLPDIRLMPRLAQIRHLPWRDMVAGPAYVIMLLQTAYGAYGVALLGGFKQYAAAGEFSIALTVIRMLPLLLGTLISALYYPRLCALYKQGNRQLFQQTAYTVLRLSTIVAAGCGALLTVYSDVIVDLLYTSRHAAAIPLLQLTAFMSLFGIIDQVITPTFVASNQAAKAIPPLLARMGIMLATLPLAALVDPALLPRIVAVGYIGSSLVGWLIQLHVSQIIGLLRALKFTIGVVGAGLAVSLTVRYVIPRPNLPYSEEGSLALAAACYGLMIALLLWQWWNAEQAQIVERT